MEMETLEEAELRGEQFSLDLLSYTGVDARSGIILGV